MLKALPLFRVLKTGKDETAYIRYCLLGPVVRSRLCRQARPLQSLCRSRQRFSGRVAHSRLVILLGLGQSLSAGL